MPPPKPGTRSCSGTTSRPTRSSKIFSGSAPQITSWKLRGISARTLNWCGETRSLLLRTLQKSCRATSYSSTSYRSFSNRGPIWTEQVFPGSQRAPSSATWSSCRRSTRDTANAKALGPDSTCRASCPSFRTRPRARSPLLWKRWRPFISRQDPTSLWRTPPPSTSRRPRPSTSRCPSERRRPWRLRRSPSSPSTPSQPRAPAGLSPSSASRPGFPRRRSQRTVKRRSSPSRPSALRPLVPSSSPTRRRWEARRTPKVPLDRRRSAPPRPACWAGARSIRRAPLRRDRRRLRRRRWLPSRRRQTRARKRRRRRNTRRSSSTSSASIRVRSRHDHPHHLPDLTLRTAVQRIFRWGSGCWWWSDGGPGRAPARHGRADGGAGWRPTAGRSRCGRWRRRCSPDREKGVSGRSKAARASATHGDQGKVVGGQERVVFEVDAGLLGQHVGRDLHLHDVGVRGREVGEVGVDGQGREGADGRVDHVVVLTLRVTVVAAPMLGVRSTLLRPRIVLVRRASRRAGRAKVKVAMILVKMSGNIPQTVQEGPLPGQRSRATQCNRPK